MSPKFKKGDVVRCIDDSAHSTTRTPLLTEGEKYTVKGSGSHYVRLEGVDLKWFVSRFELVEKDQKFSVGDKVVCVNDKGESIEEGQVYTIEKSPKDNRLVALSEIYDVKHRKFMARRFEKVEEDKSKFKPGDKVKYISTQQPSSLIKRDEVYTVDYVKGHVAFLKDVGASHGFHISRLKKVEEDMNKNKDNECPTALEVYKAIRTITGYFSCNPPSLSGLEADLFQYVEAAEAEFAKKVFEEKGVSPDDLDYLLVAYESIKQSEG